MENGTKISIFEGATYDMIKSDDSLNMSQIAANAIKCSRQSVYNIRSNLQRVNSARGPLIRLGRPRTIISPMLEALCDGLLEKPGLYLDEMAIFLFDEF